MTERGTFVYRDGQLVPKHLASPLHPRGAASDLPCPYLNRDGVDAFVSMADGATYDSKSEYRKALKAGGFREIGTDVKSHVKEAFDRMPRKPLVKPDLIEALTKVKQGYKPPPLATAFNDGLPED